MAERHVCGECYWWYWKTMLQKKPEPPECSRKIKLGWVFETDPACKSFKHKGSVDNG